MMTHQLTHKNLGQTEGLHCKEMQTLARFVARDILLTLRGKQPNSNLERAYKKLFPQGTWNSKQSSVPTTSLVTLPGQSKMTVGETAAGLVAEALGLKLIKNPPPDRAAGPCEFVFFSKDVTQTTPSALSNFFHHIKEQLIDADASACLLHNMMLAPHPLQKTVNTLISPPADFEHGTTLQHVYIGLQDTLGLKDMKGRPGKWLKQHDVVYVYESLHHFAQRLSASYSDALGDAGVSAYLACFPDHFTELPQESTAERGIPSPCNWIAFIDQARQGMFDNIFGAHLEGFCRTNKATFDIMEEQAVQILGEKVSQRLDIFQKKVWVGATRHAQDLIQSGTFNDSSFTAFCEEGEKFMTQYDLPKVQVQRMFALALAEHTSQALEKAPDTEVDAILDRFVLGTQKIIEHSDSAPDIFSYALRGLTHHMISKYPLPNPSLVARFEGTLDLTLEFKRRIALKINDLPELNYKKDFKAQVLDTLGSMKLLPSLWASSSENGPLRRPNLDRLRQGDDLGGPNVTDPPKPFYMLKR